MEEKIKAFDTVFYYFNNYKSVNFHGHYVPEVLAKAEFSCGNSHIIGKWESYCSMHSGTISLWVLYGELDKEHRASMLKWIFENYKH